MQNQKLQRNLFHSKPEKQKEDEFRKVIVADIAVYVNCASRDGISVLRFPCASTKLISWSFGLRNRKADAVLKCLKELIVK